MAKRRGSETGGVHKALSHPIRVDILLRMQEQGRLSPVIYSKGSGESLNLSAYHFRTLSDHGAIEVVDTQPRRGATEHIYAIKPESPVVRFLLASKMSETGSQDPSEEFLRRVIAQDSDNRTGVSITPVVVDREGRQEVKEILKEASRQLRDAESASRDRLSSSGEEGSRLHVAMAAFRWDQQASD